MKKLAGVVDASVNFATNTLSVSYEADKLTPGEIRAAVLAAGYDLSLIHISFSAFVQCLDACLKHIMIPHICPAIPEVILLYPGNIGKAVIIAVVCLCFILVMRQQ